nr:MAG TPA: hypothetical protein [Caudoviricetes sp.]
MKYNTLFFFIRILDIYISFSCNTKISSSLKEDK